MIPFDVHIELEPSGPNLSVQIADQIRDAIKQNTLIAGDRLPPSRQLAKDLGLARGTVTTAIEMLLAEGLLEAKTGAGTFVSEDVTVLHTSLQDDRNLPQFRLKSIPTPNIDWAANNVIDFRPCRPSLQSFPVNEWRRCCSLAASQRPSSDYADPRGDIALRVEIARYLRRARGLNVSEENMIITNGSAHAMLLIARVFDTDERDVVIEDPGYPLAKQIFELTGTKSIPIAVDNHGLNTDLLRAHSGQVKLIYVTPSHQFPIGSRLSLKRRHHLIEWAASQNALIVEDDYDGEFRFDVPALAPLAALSPGSVAYCGTFSKTLFPSLRIGFAVAPPAIIEAMANLRAISEYSPPALTQTTLKNFIQNGFFERHVQKLRKVYRMKRKQAVETISSIAPDAHVSGIESGLSTLVNLPSYICSDALKSTAKKNGILIETAGRYTLRQEHTRNALIVGYAQPSLEEIDTGLRAVFAG